MLYASLAVVAYLFAVACALATFYDTVGPAWVLWAVAGWEFAVGNLCAIVAVWLVSRGY
jgi:hypothetical protein